MRRLTLVVCGFAAVLVVKGAEAQGLRGENSGVVGRNPAQIFASDCTGSGCHNRPQGLVKSKTPNELAAYLRVHYTDSRQTAAALAAYLMGVAGEARPTRSRSERSERGERSEPQSQQQPAARQERDWLPFKLPNLFGRQEAEAPPTPQEAAPPPPRAPQRSPQASRPAPKSDAAKPDAPAKPPTDKETAAPPPTQPTPRVPPKSGQAAVPVETGTVSKGSHGSRRSEPQLPVTEDNVGAPQPSEIYRPARRNQPSGEGTMAPGDASLPAQESGPRLPIFD